ncbi:ferredoxin reductase [Streptomyces sp. NPDC005811]|uniref:ferredoxin reductase n=1 Tax=Streptomyces sp. NPDC005811 TaxID=3154565 RepID=UPI0033FD9292
MSLPVWEPGAHIEVVLPSAQVLRYALCGSPLQTDGWRIAVPRTSGRGRTADWLDEHAWVGFELRVRGPFNDFPLYPAPHYLFVAHGIGIAPLLPMVARADASGADWSLLYGGRSRPAMAFLSELLHYRERVVIWPEDRYGPLGLAGFLGDPAPSTLVYCCGTGELLTTVQDYCAAWQPGALHLRESALRTTPGTDERDELPAVPRIGRGPRATGHRS